MMASMAVKLLVCSLVCACILAPVSTQDDFIKDCQTQKMDVVFVQDASFSVGAESFQTAKLFITDIVRQLFIGHDLVRVALVRFGTYVDIIAKLSESSDVSTVSDAIAGMEYKSGGTQTGKALKAVREEVLNERREDASAVAVIITDGASISFRETLRESIKLRDKDVRLVWVYVNAEDADNNEMMREKNFMIKEGDDTFEASSFQDLDQDDRMQILQASCKEHPVLEITTEDVPTTLPVTTAPTTALPTPTTQAPLTTISQSPVTTTVPTTTTATITTAPTTTLPITQAPLTTVSQSPVTTTIPTTTTATATATTAATTLPTTTVVITTQVVTSDLLPTSASPKPSPTSTVHAGVDTTITAESVTTSAVGDGESSSSAPSSTPPDVSPADAISTSPRLTTPKPSLSTSVVTKAPEEKGNLQESDAENRASKAGNLAHGEEEEEGWENSWENIVGVVVGVFTVAAVSTGLLYLLWRRRGEKRRKVKISQAPDQNGANV